MNRCRKEVKKIIRAKKTNGVLIATLGHAFFMKKTKITKLYAKNAILFMNLNATAWKKLWINGIEVNPSILLRSDNVV